MTDCRDVCTLIYDNVYQKALSIDAWDHFFIMLDNGVTNVYDTVNIGVNDAIDNAIDLESDA